MSVESDEDALLFVVASLDCLLMEALEPKRVVKEKAGLL